MDFNKNLKNEEIVIKAELSDDQSSEVCTLLPSVTEKKKRNKNLRKQQSIQKLSEMLEKREKAIHKCKLCPYSTNYRSKMEKHARVHPGDLPFRIFGKVMKEKTEEKQFKCDHCDYKSRFNNVVMNHIKHVHSDGPEVKLYECEDCSYSTRYLTSYKVHRINHLPACAVTMFKCDQCDFQSKFSGSITKHMRRHMVDYI